MLVIYCLDFDQLKTLSAGKTGQKFHVLAPSVGFASEACFIENGSTIVFVFNAANATTSDGWFNGSISIASFKPI